MASRTVEHIIRDLNEIKVEIETLKQQIAADEKESKTAEFKALSEAERLARLHGLNHDKVRLNNLDADKKNLEKERMFLLSLLLSVFLVAHSCRMPCFFFAPLVCSFLIGVAVECAQGHAAEVRDPVQSTLGTQIRSASDIGGSGSTYSSQFMPCQIFATTSKQSP